MTKVSCCQGEERPGEKPAKKVTGIYSVPELSAINPTAILEKLYPNCYSLSLLQLGLLLPSVLLTLSAICYHCYSLNCYPLLLLLYISATNAPIKSFRFSIGNSGMAQCARLLILLEKWGVKTFISSMQSLHLGTIFSHSGVKLVSFRFSVRVYLVGN